MVPNDVAILGARRLHHSPCTDLRCPSRSVTSIGRCGRRPLPATRLPATERPGTMVHTSSAAGQVGFRIAGTAHLTLVDASPTEVDAVGRQLGLRPSTPVDDPDVVVRYHADLEPSEPMRYVELGRFGWADEQFWWLRGLGGRRVRVRLDPGSL